jgi:hypothetical protein
LDPDPDPYWPPPSSSGSGSGSVKNEYGSTTLHITFVETSSEYEPGKGTGRIEHFLSSICSERYTKLVFLLTLNCTLGYAGGPLPHIGYPLEKINTYILTGKSLGCREVLEVAYFYKNSPGPHILMPEATVLIPTLAG